MPPPGAQPGNWWWWRSSRILRDQDLLGRPIDVINEFPFFSYLLGDNHPHLLSMPFLLLLLGILLAVLSGRVDTGDNREPFRLVSCWKRVGLPLDTFVVLAITLGMLALVNTWDLLPGVLLTLLTFLVWRARAGESFAVILRSTFLLAFLLGAAILALVWPFLVTAQSQITGMLPNLLYPTRLSQFLLMAGSLLPGLCVLFFCARREFGLARRDFLRNLLLAAAVIAASLCAGYLWAISTRAGKAWLVMVGVPSAGILSEISRRWATHPFTIVFLGLFLAMGISLLVRAARAPGALPTTFALILAVAGVCLLCLPELIFLRDSFGTRMNTVFKLYYQAWPLIALAGTFGIARGLCVRGWGRSLAAAGLIAVAAGLAYPIAAIPGKIGASRARNLSGIGHWSGDELAAARWILANTRQDAIVAEGAGESYRSETSRMSAATGRATLLGWEGHEIQWRGEEYARMAGGREQVLRAIYTSAAGPEFAGLFQAHKIDFLVLGPAERSRYGIMESREKEMSAGLLTVFQNATVRIFRPRP
jgi:YYY domain-containing protein